MSSPALRSDPHLIYQNQDTRNPLATDDLSLGFGVGCKWLNTSTNETWECTANGLGAAVWVSESGASKAYGFTGLAAPGSVTLGPATLGAKVKLIFDASGSTLDASSYFESVISVAGHIQQIAGGDLHTVKFIVVLQT
jgi:hypothetical protein